jgi:hypothetical protein
MTTGEAACIVMGVIIGYLVEHWMTRKERKLGKEIGQAQFLMVRYYDEPANKVYLAGSEPVTIGRGRVEVLYFPNDTPGSQNIAIGHNAVKQ